MKRTKKPIPGEKLSDQVKRKVSRPLVEKPEYDGDATSVISTGSTLLNLAISGGRVRGGGMFGGILVEIFGPNSSGKTVLLCELAGAIQRQYGQVMFHDPEARLNKQFARIFDLNTYEMNYGNPDTVPEVFKAVRKWTPVTLVRPPGDLTKRIHGIFADSLAALSTDTEMEDKDPYGTRRAKEFSEELRKTCRVLAKENYLMVCSNQIRQTMNEFGPKYKSPGGEAIKFYSSLRLKTSNPRKIKVIKKLPGKDVERVIGVKIEVEVFKNSTWKPYRTAPVTILFDYGIDDIRENLQFIKDNSINTTYTFQYDRLSNKIDEAIKIIEDGNLMGRLQKQVIDLWENIERKFESKRKLKTR